MNIEGSDHLFLVNFPNALKVRQNVLDSVSESSGGSATDGSAGDSQTSSYISALWDEDQLDLVVTHWNNTYSAATAAAASLGASNTPPPHEFLQPSSNLMSIVRGLGKYAYSSMEELFWTMPIHLASSVEHRDYNRLIEWYVTPPKLHQHHQKKIN